MNAQRRFFPQLSQAQLKVLAEAHLAGAEGITVGLWSRRYGSVTILEGYKHVTITDTGDHRVVTVHITDRGLKAMRRGTR
jgi:hypothetical protein